LTLLRIAQAGDFFYKAGAWLFQYDATYKFKKVAPTALEQGQISTHGLLLIDSTNQFASLDQPITFAITGGTGRYRTARGEVTEPNKTERALEVEV
jgi:hypothetical protein